MFSIKQSGNFNNFDRFAKRVLGGDLYRSLDSLGAVGVDALIGATPSDSGATAAAWGYEVDIKRSGASIVWTNSNIIGGFSVAIGLQYGHGTGTGGWVSGLDYINPAIRPIFDKIADEVWKAVTNA